MFHASQRQPALALFDQAIVRISRVGNDAALPGRAWSIRDDADGLRGIVCGGVEVILQILAIGVRWTQVCPPQTVFQRELAAGFPTVLDKGLHSIEMKRGQKLAV